MLLLKEESRVPHTHETCRAEPGPCLPRQAGRTWNAFLTALLWALSVGAA
jgi:hypothetical protein